MFFGIFTGYLFFVQLVSPLFRNPRQTGVAKKHLRCPGSVPRVLSWGLRVSINGGPQWLDGLQWKILLKLMIQGYPYFRKPLYSKIHFWNSMIGTRIFWYILRINYGYEMLRICYEPWVDRVILPENHPSNGLWRWKWKPLIPTLRGVITDACELTDL